MMFFRWGPSNHCLLSSRDRQKNQCNFKSALNCRRKLEKTHCLKRQLSFSLSSRDCHGYAWWQMMGFVDFLFDKGSTWPNSMSSPQSLCERALDYFEKVTSPPQRTSKGFVNPAQNPYSQQNTVTQQLNNVPELLNTIIVEIHHCSYDCHLIALLTTIYNTATTVSKERTKNKN